IATGGTSAVASDGTVTTSFDVDNEDPAPSARPVDGADVAGVRVATTARRTVVVLVPAGQRALINRGRSGTWPNIALPLPAGAQAGLTPLLSLPADATSLRFDPTPGNLNVVQQGSLGGGIVTPLGAPFGIAVTAPVAPDATIDLSFPSVKVGAGQAFGYLVSVNAPDGSFFGYLRAPAIFEPSTGRQTWPMTAKALDSTLFLPVALTPAYVQNFSADTHIHSGPDALAVDFGVAGPAFTTFTVVGPQMGNRIYVYSPVTRAYGWVDASGVGPSGPAVADTPVPTNPPPAPDDPPASTPGEWPEYVRNTDASTHMPMPPTSDPSARHPSHTSSSNAKPGATTSAIRSTGTSSGLTSMPSARRRHPMPHLPGPNRQRPRVPTCGPLWQRHACSQVRMTMLPTSVRSGRHPSSLSLSRGQ
ncbi:MAG: hypothetical protein EBS94_14855, partial [Proteobacteria bacterium]|nr:hypothetical protein [Pseudomonadota bacterium]